MKQGGGDVGLKRRHQEGDEKRETPRCERLEDEKSGLLTKVFFCTSPTSSEQMLDPQASSSRSP